MKLISFVVPCYNSQSYMSKCIDSLLTGNDEVEIIIVNDGSVDDTVKIAREYEKKYPSIIKVVDKENGGHGSGVNAGMKIASGLYYKVVDSDDWVDVEALKALLDSVRANVEAGTLPDLYITNYIYDHAYDNTTHRISYKTKIKPGEITTWDKIKGFNPSQYLMIHSLMYRLEKLLASGTVLPEHTFYVDEIYAYKPLPQMQTVFYLDVDLYHYFIGRADQSVNINNMRKRYKQQLNVMLVLTDAYKWDYISSLPKGLKKYMWHCLEVLMITTFVFIHSETSKERKQEYKEMWQHIKDKDLALYKRLKHRSYATLLVYFPWWLRKFILDVGYKFFCKFMKLG